MSQALNERAAPALERLEALYPEIDALYLDLHQHPELSLQEVQTAAKVAARLQALGYEVTTNVGGTGVVGLLRNGSGPVVMQQAGKPMALSDSQRQQQIATADAQYQQYCTAQ